LTGQSPAFVDVTPLQVERLNPVVGAMIRGLTLCGVEAFEQADSEVERARGG